MDALLAISRSIVDFLTGLRMLPETLGWPLYPAVGGAVATAILVFLLVRLSARRKAAAKPAERPKKAPRAEHRPMGAYRFAGGKLSLSLDGTSVRLLIYQRRKVIDWINLPFNPELMKEGLISDPAGMAKVIRNALREKRIGERKVRAALPAFGVLSRLLTLPPGRDIRPGEVIPREARRLISVPPEENYLFWQKLAGPEYEQRFLVLAVPRQPLHALLETLKLAGLRPTAIELSSLCLARAVNRSTAIILEAEPNLIGVVIVVDGIPVLMRSSPLSGETLLPSASAPRLAQELAQNLSFYNSAHRENPLPPDAPVYLCGSLAVDPELARRVESIVAHPVRKPELILESPPDFPAPHFMVNIGLAMRDL